MAKKMAQSNRHIPALMTVLHDTGRLLPRDNAVNKLATPEQHRQVLDLVRRGLDQGALGVGLGMVLWRAGGTSTSGFLGPASSAAGVMFAASACGRTELVSPFS